MYSFIIEGLLLFSMLLDETMLPVLILCLKHFIDWLRGLTCYRNYSNVNRNFHLVYKYIIAYISAATVCENVLCYLYNSFPSIIDLGDFDD